MNNKINLIIIAGFILLIIGGFLKTQDIEFGEFLSTFSLGVLSVGVFQFLYILIKKQKIKQQN